MLMIGKQKKKIMKTKHKNMPWQFLVVVCITLLKLEMQQLSYNLTASVNKHSS